MKELFKEFCSWFVRNRYLRYLLIEGKMADKKAYIKYKNHILLSILNENYDIKGSQDIGSDGEEEEMEEERESMEESKKEKEKGRNGKRKG
jgi:hypothetical protein